ncbi:hypothetical protein BHM03_00020734 [Ensete ventricosum]|nr:hypothetical protein BHM03_00020734 [Ensete ventricosum]
MQQSISKLWVVTAKKRKFAKTQPLDLKHRVSMLLLLVVDAPLRPGSQRVSGVRSVNTTGAQRELTLLTFIPSLFPPTVSRAGRMSSFSSHSESRSIKILAHRSRVLSHPSEDCVSVAVVPSSSAPGDSRTADALTVLQSFFNVDSTVTTRRLVKARKNYFIPPEYKLYVPLLGERPYDAFSSGFNLSTDALEAGLRFSLHPMIEACLE